MEYNFLQFRNLSNCTINLPNEMTVNDKFTFYTVSNLFINNFQATNIRHMFERDNFSNLPNFINFDRIETSVAAFKNSSITKLEDITLNINSLTYNYENTFNVLNESNKSFTFNNVNFPLGYSNFITANYKNIYFQNVMMNSHESKFNSYGNLVINDSYFEVNNFAAYNLYNSHNFTIKTNNFQINNISNSNNFTIDSKTIKNTSFFFCNPVIKNTTELHNVYFYSIPYTERENILDMQNITVYNHVRFNSTTPDNISLNLPSAKFIGLYGGSGDNYVPRNIYAPNNTIYSLIYINTDAYNINFHQNYIYVNYIEYGKNLDKLPQKIVKFSSLNNNFQGRNFIQSYYNTLHLTFDVENLTDFGYRGEIHRCSNAIFYFNFINVNQECLRFTLGSASNARIVHMNFGNITFNDFDYYYLEANYSNTYLEDLSIFEGVQISNMLNFDLQYTNKLQESFGREFFEMLIRSKTNYPQLRLNQSLNMIFRDVQSITESLYNEYPELNNLGIKW